MKTSGLVALVLLALTPALVLAQQQGRPTQARPAVQPPPAAPAFNVGVVDITSVLRRSTATQALQRQMQAEQEKYQVSADQQQRSLQAEEESVERLRASLSAEVYTQKRQEFQDKVNRTTTEFRGRRRQIDEAFNKASGEINRTLAQVIEELARARAMELVVRREAVLYLQDGEDLTEQSLETLNRRLPQVEIDLPSAQP